MEGMRENLKRSEQSVLNGAQPNTVLSFLFNQTAVFNKDLITFI